MAVRKKPIAKWRHIADFTSRGILTFRRVFNSGVMDEHRAPLDLLRSDRRAGTGLEFLYLDARKVAKSFVAA